MNKIKELEQKVKELQEEISKIKNEETPIKWEPKRGEKYCFLADCGSSCLCTWLDDERDDWRYNNLKLFKTIEECEQYRKFIEDVNKYKWEFTEEEWKNSNDKYFIYHDYDSDALETCCDVSERTMGCVYFKTEEDAQYIIDNYKEEILKGWL